MNEVINRLRFILLAASVLFAAFCGIQGWIIANIGAANAVPQLEGDGGGIVLFACLVFIAGGLSFIRTIPGLGGYVIAILVAFLVALLFQDPVVYFFASIAFLLCTLNYFVHRVSRIRTTGSGVSAKPQRVK